MSLLVDLWQAVPEQIRFPLLRVVQRNKPLYRWLMFRHADLKDRSNGSRAHLPPAELRYRVGGSPDAEEFVTIGKTCANDIQAALQKVGREVGSFERILDFGVGCGRTMVHIREMAPQSRIEGTDIDANAIRWCRENLKFASFSLSKETPPIGYEANSFDLIYVISVFTHLDEDYQFRWLEELQRIAKPGAIIVLTVNGSKNGQGFFFERSYEEGLFPAWYQNSYHSRAYVFENFGRYFTVLQHLPQSMNAHQDVVVLEKRS